MKYIPIIILISLCNATFLSSQEKPCYEMFIQEGKLSIDTSGFDYAIKQFKAAKQCWDSPDDHTADSLIAVAQNLFKTGILDEREKLFDYQHNDYFNFLEKGYSYLSDDQFEQAKTAFQRAIEISEQFEKNPDKPEGKSIDNNGALAREKLTATQNEQMQKSNRQFESTRSNYNYLLEEGEKMFEGADYYGSGLKAKDALNSLGAYAWEIDNGGQRAKDLIKRSDEKLRNFAKNITTLNIPSSQSIKLSGFEKAVFFYNEALKGGQSAGLQYRMAYAALNKALKKKKQLKNDNLLGYAYMIQAICALEIKDYKKARILTKSTLTYMKQIGPLNHDLVKMKVMDELIIMNQIKDEFYQLSNSQTDAESFMSFFEENIYNKDDKIKSKFESVFDIFDRVAQLAKRDQDIQIQLITYKLETLKIWIDALSELKYALRRDQKYTDNRKNYEDIEDAFFQYKEEFLDKLSSILTNGKEDERYIYWRFML